MKIKVLLIRDHHITAWNGQDTLIGIDEKGKVVAIVSRKQQDIKFEEIEDGGDLLG